MQWLSYKIVCNEDRNILVTKRLEDTPSNRVLAVKESNNGSYTVESGAYRFTREFYFSQPVFLKYGVTYGDELPATGEEGQLFFKKVT